MYTKFNYYPSRKFYEEILSGELCEKNSRELEFKEKGKHIHKENEKEVKKFLKSIYEDGNIDGTRLKDNWFAISKKDVFISYSHEDIDKVEVFAGWLHKVFGLNVFIDSCSWGYCDKLLKIIDDKYCKNDNSHTYDYKLRNITTSHVHMMLSTALTEMMYNSECIIFFNTPTSINISNNLESMKDNKTTKSPWIFHELMMTTMLKINKPDREMNINEHYPVTYDRIEKSINIDYDVSKALGEMKTITDTELVQWYEEWKKSNNNPLDILYKIILRKNKTVTIYKK